MDAPGTAVCQAPHLMDSWCMGQVSREEAKKKKNCLVCRYISTFTAWPTPVCYGIICLRCRGDNHVCAYRPRKPTHGLYPKGCVVLSSFSNWTSHLMTGRKELRTRGITGAKKMLVDYCTCSRFCTTGSRKANSGLDLRKPAILDIPPSRN